MNTNSKITAEQIVDAINAGLDAGADESDWDAPEFAAARDLTEAAGMVWDFDGWADARMCLSSAPRKLGGVDLTPWDEAYTLSSIPRLVVDAINHANWFPEQDERLRKLARAGKASEIRTWAEQIRSDWSGTDEDNQYWQETADHWDGIADAIDELKAGNK